MDPTELALKHFEKVILVAFLGWLGFTLTNLASEPSGLQKAAAVETHLEKIDKHMKTTTVEAPKEPVWESNLKRQLDPGSVPAAAPFPAWVMERRPSFLYQIEIEAPEYHTAHHAPTVDAAPVERGKIKVTWEPSNENLYVVATFEVHRKTGDAEQWEKMAELPTTERSWVDDKINSRKKYSYKVVSLAKIDQEDPVVQQNKLVLPDEERLKESSPVGPIGVKQDFMILPTEVHPVTEEELIKNKDAKAWATIKVKKWDAEGNAWEEKTYFQKNPGWKVGQKEKIKRKEVDFSTGAELLEVEIRTRKAKRGDFEEKVHVIKVKWPDGQTEEFTSKDEEDAKEAEAPPAPPGGGGN